MPEEKKAERPRGLDAGRAVRELRDERACKLASKLATEVEGA
jgi:hypothetical protein